MGVRNTDVNLIQLAVRGNADAFSALFEHYFDSVYHFALWLCGDPQLAEDLTQETFIRAHKNMHKLGPPWNMRSWMYRMARNLYFDMRRREPEVHPLDPQSYSSSDADPEYHLVMSELSGPVRSALQRLSPNHREALILREVEHMQYEDIAAVMGISLDNVKVVLHRARSSFKDMYGVRLLMEDPLPDCQELNELLDAMCDGEPLGAQEARVREHLKGCPTCQQRKREAAALALLLGNLPKIGPLPGIHGRVLGKVNRHIFGGGAEDRRRRWNRLSAVAAAEAAIILIFWLWRFMGLPDPTGGMLPMVFPGGDGRGGGSGADTIAKGTPSPVPASLIRLDVTPSPGAIDAAGPQPGPQCTPNPNDNVCSACENTDLDSNNCVCNMNGVCDPQEGLNCPDCGPHDTSGSGGNKPGPVCGCKCDQYDSQTKKCLKGHDTCTNAFCMP